MLDLDAIKMGNRVRLPGSRSRVDIDALLAEVERLRRIEAAACAYVESYDKATYEGYDNLHEQERLWQLVGESEATNATDD